jgi:hypothetical protein
LDQGIDAYECLAWTGQERRDLTARPKPAVAGLTWL